MRVWLPLSSDGNDIATGFVELVGDTASISKRSLEDIGREDETKAALANFVSNLEHSITKFNCRNLANIEVRLQITEFHTRTPTTDNRATVQTALCCCPTQVSFLSLCGTD